MAIPFKNPESAAQFTNTCEKDINIIVTQSKPGYRGPLSEAPPQALDQMIKEGIPYVSKKVASKTINPTIN